MSGSLDRWTRLWSWISRPRLRAEVEDELSFHLDRLIQDFEARGMEPEEARRAAEARFGDPRRIRRLAFREERSRVRQQKRVQYMDNLRQDLRFAFRQLWKRPVFSGIALGMLALGIGANTAIFSVVYAVLLKPLPFPEPDRLVRIWESRVEQGWERAAVAPGNFPDLREMNRTFLDLGTYRWTSRNLTGGEYPELLRVGQVSAGFFGTVLGVRPVLGRTFVEGDDEPGGENHIALLANTFWQSHFGSDPDVMGTRLILDGEGYTVVGVLPPGRPWLNSGDVYLPLVRNPEASRSSFEQAVIGRLLPGMTLEAGLQDLNGVARRMEEAFPEELAGIGITVGPSSEWTADENTRQALWILLGAVGFLLMIACVNLANLFLARATGRTRETAIRAATGASRGRLIRQGLTESLLTSVLGAGLGLGLAFWGVDALTAMAPDSIAGLSEVSLNRWVLLFTLGAGVFTGLVTGLVPSFQASGGDAASTLRSGGRSIAGSRTHHRLRGVLVGAEVALSLILLVGAGLLLRSFDQLMGAERGFETDDRLLASVNLPDDYQRQDVFAFHQQLLERMEAVGPVINAALIHIRPLAGSSTGLGFARPGAPEAEGGTPWASWRLVTQGYFETLGVPILKGRDFRTEDYNISEGDLLPTIISNRIAQELWPGEDPLGQTITLWAGQTDQPGQVVGVVGDMRERGIDEGPTFAVYFPYVSPGWDPDIVIHTAGDPTAVIPALRAIAAELDPNIPLTDITTMEEMVGQSVGSQRFLLVLVSLFAGLALLLALAGVYGVQSYSVAQQTAEIGVRKAMGAQKGQILKRIILQAMRPAVLGVVGGLVGAWALSRFLESLLFQVRATDAVTYAGVAGILVLAALVSAWIPAVRATKVDPVIAFRAE